MRGIAIGWLLAGLLICGCYPVRSDHPPTAGEEDNSPTASQPQGPPASGEGPGPREHTTLRPQMPDANLPPSLQPPPSQPRPAPPPSSNQALDFAYQLSYSFQSAAGRVVPSVVTIQKIGPASDQEEEETAGPDSFFRRFFGEEPRSGPSERRISMGSGVIIDPSGIILTNNHVVAGSGKTTVRLHDGREFQAADIKTDPRSDLAVVRIRGAGNLPAASLGDSSTLKTGDWVLAVGNPFGLDATVTAGIISATGRGLGISPHEEYLQTDAAINPGNSGGPLVNLRGEIVGINTAISTTTGGYQGIGFAIPSNLVRWVAAQLIEHGKVQRAYLGVGVQKVTPDLAEQLGLKEAGGVLVTRVAPRSPAADAHVAEGDVILQFAGHPVNNPSELQSQVEQAPIGSRQSVLIFRKGKQYTTEVQVREQPADYGRKR